MNTPRYLRVVVTERCPMACAYCHHEGVTAVERGTSAGELVMLVGVAVARGVRKVKLLGGEPLVRADIPEVVRGIRALDATLDLSLITSGAAPTARLAAAFDAGLSRANMSIHGFSREAFLERGGRPGLLPLRDRALAWLLDRGAPLKLNFVYRGARDHDDLGALLDWAAGLPVVVNVLDELGRSDLGPAAVLRAVTALRGPEARRWIDPDPYSLDTLHLAWADGLEVEVKHQALGALAPWQACASCPVRARCTEGIHAVRLTPDGRLRPCMDRADLGVSLAEALRAGGPDAALAAWDAFLSRDLVRRAA